MGFFTKKRNKKIVEYTAKLLMKMAEKGIRPRCSAIIVAAGSASRMQGIDKIFADFHGMTVLERAAEPFAASKLVDEIIVVTRRDDVPRVELLLRGKTNGKPLKVVPGGDTRTDSVLAGLSVCDEKTKIAAVHDGARPFVTKEIVEDTIRTAAEKSAAAPAVPVKDTIKIAKNRVIESTPDRSTLFAAQTPQTFAIELLRAGIRHARANGIALTDDCSAVEAIGVPVILTEGSYENIKLTTPEDLWFAQALLKRRQEV